MSDNAWCYLALVTGLTVLAIITWAVLSAPRSGMFRSFGEVRDAWRTCANLGEKRLLIWTLTLQLMRGGIYTFLVLMIGTVMSMTLSLCGTNPRTVEGVLDFLRDWLKMPPRPVSSHP